MGIQFTWKTLQKCWSPEPPVENVDSFDSVEVALGQRLPADYKWFLMESNGGETLPPLPRIRLYPLDELLARRTDGQPPDVLEFATNDSDGYAFDLAVNRDQACYAIVRYPLGDRTRDDTHVCLRDFAEFLSGVASGKKHWWLG